jgi:phosphatidylserine/phosphatidylglycerophosphate/cardiolipin synthase-like enzyme
MEWTLERIDGWLRDTFADARLSRSERQALTALAETSPEMRLRLRRRAFELAPALAAESDVTTMLTWLEEVEKALFAVPSTSPRHDDIEVWFSPHQEVWARIVRAIESLQSHVDLAVFTVTDDRITRALLDAHRRGVRLRIVSDNDKANDPGSDIERLAAAGVAVRIDRTLAHMHHKFAILDGRTLLNGSYNWTRGAANENHENIVIQSSALLVEHFEREFEHCWKLAEPW